MQEKYLHSRHMGKVLHKSLVNLTEAGDTGLLGSTKQEHNYELQK
jgi:hypothetical protein